ncbi:hypothetical protein [Roseovarius atlanticus]|uniref:hypothetical protein n=1 Tax=Roseovarius atlanticus TaxID=1641875 RepID=UPI001C93F035|nr:hypothetical protein [Roseovarius atlanticus]MBY6127065.1 hypothetical protein [Roseovarius atlanticus]MBY6151559.1 hypothetical protein [Roseovarius atlanticus]
MKIAAVCAFPFWQADIGSAVRMDSLCRALSDICELHVLCSAPLSEDHAGFAEIAPYQLLDGAALGQIARAAPGSGLPAVRAIAQYCAAQGVEVEQLPRHILRIIDTHDCQSQRARSFAQHGLIPTFVMDAVQEGALLDAPERRAALDRQMRGNLEAEQPAWQPPLLHLLAALRETRQEAGTA